MSLLRELYAFQKALGSLLDIDISSVFHHAPHDHMTCCMVSELQQSDTRAAGKAVAIAPVLQNQGVIAALPMHLQRVNSTVHLAPRSAHLSRKPLLSQAWRSPLPCSQTCLCGRPLQSERQPAVRRRTYVTSAAAVTSVRPQANTKKRKQPEPLLVVEGISKSHDGQRILFQNLDFTVRRGDRLALVGPNGAGKSSLFNLLSGE